MAIAATMAEQVLHDQKNNGLNRQEIQAAIAKAVELRALHAALVQGNPPATLKITSSPALHPASKFSAQDYPVFTPSYDDDPVIRYPNDPGQIRTHSGTWDDYLGGSGIGTDFADYKMDISSSRKGLPSSLTNIESHFSPAEDQRSVTGSCANNITVLQTSPRTDYKSSWRNNLGDFKSFSSCNNDRPASVTTEPENEITNGRDSNIVAPLTDSHSSIQAQPKNRGIILSWLFPRLKKKQKSKTSPNRTESEEVSQAFTDLGIVSSIEALKRELIEVNEKKNAALKELSGMKSSLGDLKRKLEYLESYCEGLKKALRQTTQSSFVPEELGNLPRNERLVDRNGESSLPVTIEAMVEGFLQIVSEARLSVKQFCKTLISQIEETDTTLVDNLNLLLQPYKLSMQSKNSKAVLYHLEAILNQALYQDFENCVFQTNGSPKILDPEQDRQAQFQSFVSLRNLSWNEVLKKGTKFYSEEFSRFCDQRMSRIITTLNWTRPWPEQLLQAFFISAKCIWLLHLLAFSFNPPLSILRVDENRTFNPHYMEDMFTDRQRSHGPTRVKVMVMPGFYVQDQVLRSKVLCRYKVVP